MHPVVYEAFEERCALEKIEGAVLEVGAVGGPESLLRLPSLRGANPKIGLNLTGAGDYGDYRIVQGNANDMRDFSDGQFSAVLCNATLEHDRRFWLTLGEIRRVTAPGGLIAIGVPGYAGMGIRSVLGPAYRLFGKFLPERHRAAIGAGTLTLGVHRFPSDYYRFSEAAVREIFMEGLSEVGVRTVLSPPRILAWGRKK